MKNLPTFVYKLIEFVKQQLSLRKYTLDTFKVSEGRYLVT